jgi:hypothetical protein
LVLLKIKVDAAYSKNALYSDINAADSNHTHGSTIEHLKRVDFSATKQHYVSRESPFFKKTSYVWIITLQSLKLFIMTYSMYFMQMATHHQFLKLNSFYDTTKKQSISEGKHRPFN